MPEALSGMDHDVEAAIDASAKLSTVTATTDVEACAARVVDHIRQQRCQAAVSKVFFASLGEPAFPAPVHGPAPRTPGTAGFLQGSATLACAVKEATRSGCLDCIASLSVETVVREASRSRNAAVLRASVARVAAETGLSVGALASIAAPDDLDPAVAKDAIDRAVLSAIRDDLTHAPGKFAGYADARHSLWLSIECIYADGADRLHKCVAEGSLDGVVEWFAERNARADSRVRHAVATNGVACPLCTWCIIKHTQQRNITGQSLWTHVKHAHGVV